MTDSTTDSPGDGKFDVGSSVNDLFGKLEDPESGDQPRIQLEDGDETDGEETDGVEDRTAADVFDQLQTEAANEGTADDVLADESPDDIIASADEPEPAPETPVDDALVADGDALTELLLTGRTKEREFLWVDSNGSDDPRDGEPTDRTSTDEGTEGADEETPSVDDTVDLDAATATATGTVDEPSDGEPVVENGSADAVEPDVAAVTDTDTESNTDTAVDADATPETPSNPSDDTLIRNDDTGSSLEAESDTHAVDDAETADHDGDGMGSDTDTEGTETETASDDTGNASAADDEPSGLLGRLRSLLNGLF
ncbi:hypothetical protein [Natrinema sp. SYSU A 869]|uniref:hypothetical protein n=1 Tax=Natrinema sp. SYSU A 869 TaxID=2871694 RepID=UPI001CA3C9BD|nr:hypothetical protein [Natrinema sp. SYSU A 869]